MNLHCSSFSFGDRGYTRELMDAGALVLRSMAWSQGLFPGNCSDACSENTFPCSWYCVGTSSCHVHSFLSVALSANCCAIVTFFAHLTLSNLGNLSSHSLWENRVMVSLVMPIGQSICRLIENHQCWTASFLSLVVSFLPWSFLLVEDGWGSRLLRYQAGHLLWLFLLWYIGKCELLLNDFLLCTQSRRRRPKWLP